MGLGGIRGGGRRGGAGKGGGASGTSGSSGAKGPSGPGKAGPASGGDFGGRVDKLQSTMGSLATSGPGGVSDVVTAKALEIRAALAAGLKSARDEESKKRLREKAERQLVEYVLEHEMRLKSRVLTNAIAQRINEDPDLGEAMNRILSPGA